MATKSISENLKLNKNNWNNVKLAIEDKGVSTLNKTTTEYADLIKSIKAVLEEKNITPSTSLQVIVPDADVEGFNKINVSAVTSDIDNNIIPDTKWDEWAKELVQLQKDYPEISEKVRWYEYFKDWDASTGAFLPLKDEWVIKKAKQISQLFGVGVKEKGRVVSKPKQPGVKKPSPQKVLF